MADVRPLGVSLAGIEAIEHDGAEDLATWRREVRTWLTANRPSGHDLDQIQAGDVDAQRRWERRLFDGGLAAVHWPIEHGGRGATAAASIVFQEEYERLRLPARLNVQGLMLAGPTLMRFGTPDQCDRWLEPILRCEELWCQGFSEPDAGSDLAALRTAAVREGDEYVVNGQKIWTSGAEIADWIFALVRTDPSAARHRGISWLMIDMHSPGIDIRPIRQINGRADFAEVFFDEVRVPAVNVVGPVNSGWTVAMAALAFERGVGRRTYVKFLHDLAQLRRFARAEGPVDDVLTEELGQLLAEVLTYRHHVDNAVADGESWEPGPRVSFNKLYWSEMQTRIYELGIRVLGSASSIEEAEVVTPEARLWQEEYWYSRAARIFAGSNEIQKNLIAERVLGLPREPLP